MVARIFRQPGARALRRREAVYGYLFAAPWFIGFFGLVLGPILASLILSFTNYALLAPPHPIGFSNYTKLFAHDALFWTSIGNTIYYTVFTVPLSVAIALLLALLLNQPIKGVRIFRTIFYLPAVTSSVAVVLLWGWLLNPNVGLVNRALETIGLPGPGCRRAALPSVSARARDCLGRAPRRDERLQPSRATRTGDLSAKELVAKVDPATHRPGRCPLSQQRQAEGERGFGPRQAQLGLQWPHQE
ncbi:MAG: sugar ABC transporter permease [Chloroflexi bacterium]|nr:sugar ABC transporter permease [Chloroflexota bacterium]